MAIKKGDQVSVHYTGKFSNGEVFDSSEGREPLEFTIGMEQVIPGFENAIIGHETGDKLTVSITPKDGYGDIDQDLIFVVSRTQVPDDIPLKIGTPIQLSSDKGTMDVVISEIEADEITLDANHPLAGKDLIFDIDILDHKPAKQ